MKRNILLVSSVVIAVIIAILIVMFNTQYNYMPNKYNTISNTISREESVEPSNITLIDYRLINILGTYKYYVLSNGSTIAVPPPPHPDPFPFKIELRNVNRSVIHKKLPVYKLEYPEEPDEVMKVARTLLSLFGVEVSSLEFNNVTKAFLYSNPEQGIRLFEYYIGTDKGFFRIIFENPRIVNYTLFMERVRLIVDDKITYKSSIIEKPYTWTETIVPAASAKPAESQAIAYAIIYKGFLKDMPVPYAITSVLFKCDGEGKVLEIEGTLPKKIIEIGSYPVIPIEQICKLLTERVSGKIKAGDWYISYVGFTKLTITNITLEYYETMTTEKYLVPIYRFTGEWTLNYDEINDHGSLNGFIIAVALSK
ncbi:hypothetical protein [Staphylothermus hellenicus]|uniref:Uncharacterized protein n=1 Tax=Staphylothermus hellenicus (strain DSM 12710 / JCM 10830 / BK20S6-10-b1 / P8) TaxID=591019 RepID=D7D7X6_STAHD|nr:hypothetical protein [Staphylothermus hellenicus]ADI31872.1 hypothetical protein Shell_0756 [Staphylothermus hellenicus DSM 12710]